MNKILFFLSTILVPLTSCGQQASSYHGIDISHHNKSITWSKVKRDKNIQFVYMKGTEGSTYLDPAYKKNFRNAKEIGIKVGTYHFFRMTSGAKEQFQNFRTHIKKEEQNLIPMVDVETTDHHSVRETRDSLKVFLDLVEEYYGTKPIIYGTNRSYNTICGIGFNSYKLYLGRYGSRPPVIRGKEHYLIWQFSESGKISGISKSVDLCRFHPAYSIKDILYTCPKWIFQILVL